MIAPSGGGSYNHQFMLEKDSNRFGNILSVEVIVK